MHSLRVLGRNDMQARNENHGASFTKVGLSVCVWGGGVASLVNMLYSECIPLNFLTSLSLVNIL